MSSLLECLPRSVLTTVLEKVVEISNPGAAFRVALVSKKLLQSVATVEGLWLGLCRKQGWRKPPAGTAAKPRSDTEEALWFQYYCYRMQLRWRTRRFMRLYTPFMTRASSMALLPGATVPMLDAAEQRLNMGLGLPWELWELHRFRNGQAEATGVRFAEDCRLLSVQEMYTEPLAAGTLPWTPQAAALALASLASSPAPDDATALSPSDQTVLQRGAVARLLAVVQAPDPSLPPHHDQHPPSSDSAGALPATTAFPQHPAPLPQLHQQQQQQHQHQQWPPLGQEVLRDDVMVFFAENTSGKRRFAAVASTGQVVVTSGMSVILCAHSVAAFLQRLLT